MQRTSYWHCGTLTCALTWAECQIARVPGLSPRVRAYARVKAPTGGTLTLCARHSPLDLGTLPGTLPRCWHSAQVSGSAP